MKSCKREMLNSNKLRPSSIRLCAMLLLCAATLPGCASSPTNEPPLTPTQETTVSQDASDYSERARNWLERVRKFLQEQ